MIGLATPFSPPGTGNSSDGGHLEVFQGQCPCTPAGYNNTIKVAMHAGCVGKAEKARQDLLLRLEVA